MLTPCLLTLSATCQQPSVFEVAAQFPLHDRASSHRIHPRAATSLWWWMLSPYQPIAGLRTFPRSVGLVCLRFIPMEIHHDHHIQREIVF